MGALGGRKEEREWGVFRNWSGRKGRVNRERAIREKQKKNGKARKRITERGTRLGG